MQSQIPLRTETEEEYRLTESDVAVLSQYAHALDYRLNAEQTTQLEDNGYLVIPGFFNEQLMTKMVEQMFERAHSLVGVKRDDPSTWPGHFVKGFDLWHLPAYYEIRSDRRLYSIFAQLLRDPKLTVSLDRVCIKTPAWIEAEDKSIIDMSNLLGHLPVHTDMNLWHIESPAFQASVCLEDCPIGAGGFTVMPGYHKLNKIQTYRAKYEAGEYDGQPRPPPSPESIFEYYIDKEAIARDLVEVPMNKGDLLIWSSRLPHASATNRSNRWRLQCYVRFVSSTERHVSNYRDVVRESVKTFRKPTLFSTGNATNNRNCDWEMQFLQEVPMTDLDRKLLGFYQW